MTAATPRTLEGCVDCKMLKYEAEIRLVDELDQPLPNVPYILSVGYDGKYIRRGKSDGGGVLHEKELPPGPLHLTLVANPLAEVLQEPHRHLRLERSDYGTPVQRAAEKQGRLHRYARFGEVADALPTLFEKMTTREEMDKAAAGEQSEEDRARQPLPPYHFPHGDPAKASVARRPLYAFSKAGARSIKITIEITPLRAWVLMLEHSPEYNLGNAYNLALMAHLAYADGKANEANAEQIKQQATGYVPTANERAHSIEHFFVEQMQELSRLPYGINALSKAALVKDVPYRDRYETPKFIDATELGPNGEAPPSGMFGDKFDSQFFYVQRPGELIVSWRGTASLSDAFTDLNFTPVSCQKMEIAKQGKAHEGFYKQFEVVAKHPKPEIAEVYKTIASMMLRGDRKLYICGHSLGGALALLHAANLKAYNPLLYTYGMPRTLTQSALRELTFPHFRHRNERDKVTSLPPGRGVDTPLARVPIIGKVTSAAALLVPDLDPYGHHGKLIHFNQTNTRYVKEIRRLKEREEIVTEALPAQVKSLVIPHLAAEGKAIMDERAKAALASAYPSGDNPSHGGGDHKDSHPSGKYADYLQVRLLGLLDKQQNQSDPHDEKVMRYLSALKDWKDKIEPKVSWRENGALELDNQLLPLLPQAQIESEEFAISRLWQAPRR